MTALIAYCIDVGESVLFDWKEGYCSTKWTLDRKFCCWDAKCITPGFVDIAGECTAWRTWSSILPDPENSQLVTHLIYIAFATAFSIISSLLTLLTKSVYPLPNTPETQGKVKILYTAAGSGIPEVKTILSGFVIRKFLGLRTLLVKAVGLTLSVASGMSLGKEGWPTPITNLLRSLCTHRLLCGQYRE